jgi:hypothetical protein
MVTGQRLGWDEPAAALHAADVGKGALRMNRRRSLLLTAVFLGGLAVGYVVEPPTRQAPQAEPDLSEHWVITATGRAGGPIPSPER